MAADLQEPPELLVEFFERLEAATSTSCSASARPRRPAVSRRLGAVLAALPPVRAAGRCRRAASTSSAATRAFARRDPRARRGELVAGGPAHLARLPPRRRCAYERQERDRGHERLDASRKKVRYMADSIFSFTDLPIRLLLAVGVFGCVSVSWPRSSSLVAWASSEIEVPGYTPLILSILFSASSSPSASASSGPTCGGHTTTPSGGRSRSAIHRPTSARRQCMTDPSSSIRRALRVRRTVGDGTASGRSPTCCPAPYRRGLQHLRRRVHRERRRGRRPGHRQVRRAAVGRGAPRRRRLRRPQRDVHQRSVPAEQGPPERVPPAPSRRRAPPSAPTPRSCPGVTIGRRAMVGAGAVVTARARQRDGRRQPGADHRLRRRRAHRGADDDEADRRAGDTVDGVDADALPEGVRVVEVPNHTDLRGSLAAGEVDVDFPFVAPPLLRGVRRALPARAGRARPPHLLAVPGVPRRVGHGPPRRRSPPGRGPARRAATAGSSSRRSCGRASSSTAPMPCCWSWRRTSTTATTTSATTASSWRWSTPADAAAPRRTGRFSPARPSR